MSNLGFRVKQLRKKLNLKQEEVAKIAGITQQTLASLESGLTTGSRKIPQLAKALKTNPAYLEYGVEAGQGNLITIIEWNKVADWCRLNKKINQEDINVCYVNYTHKNSNKLSLPYQFALLNKNTMSYKSRTFENGCYFICDPIIKPKNNCYVIARRMNESEVVVRKYIMDGDKAYLHPLYPGIEVETLNDKCKDLAVIIATIDPLVNFDEVF